MLLGLNLGESYIDGLKEMRYMFVIPRNILKLMYKYCLMDESIQFELVFPLSQLLLRNIYNN